MLTLVSSPGKFLHTELEEIGSEKIAAEKCVRIRDISVHSIKDNGTPESGMLVLQLSFPERHDHAKEEPCATCAALKNISHWLSAAGIIADDAEHDHFLSSNIIWGLSTEKERGGFCDSAIERAISVLRFLGAVQEFAVAGKTYRHLRSPKVTQETMVCVRGYDERDPSQACWIEYGSWLGHKHGLRMHRANLQ